MPDIRLLLLNVRLGNQTMASNDRSTAGKTTEHNVKRLSLEYKLAWISADASMFGFFMKSDRPLPVIRAEVMEGLLNDDSIIVLELGEDFTGHGFSNGWTWLQHHQ